MFNALLGGLMGVFHQGGVVPVQTYIAEHLGNATTVVWWKTYSPPTWLLGEMGERCVTADLMGAERGVVAARLEKEKGGCGKGKMEEGRRETYLVAPVAMDVESGLLGEEGKQGFTLRKVWVYRNHLGLDDLDLDFKRDGVLGAVIKVVDARGLGIWRVEDPADQSCVRS